MSRSEEFEVGHGTACAACGRLTDTPTKVRVGKTGDPRDGWDREVKMCPTCALGVGR